MLSLCYLMEVNFVGDSVEMLCVLLLFLNECCDIVWCDWIVKWNYDWYEMFVVCVVVKVSVGCGVNL